ncbi:aspartate/glutamate racemase family protein [Sphingomonas crocodyli]|uniref:Aspartate/glutamate racemase family protein n=1 Tax=Sphingomonas crocodyli TaxID=1979270 RepID=A0A437M0Q3_9SPHN|nr:aspartate/glutamate racemase family protein [Sphingomonas crocodyli]RVT91267.1 aspartate/glutamate racemase family protein [Sphingomonas crocodyli]
MKTIGILGGMSWESSAAYYALINRGVRDRLGPPHSARTLMLSVDFAEIATRQHDGDWAGLEAMMVAEARHIEAGGADMLLIATNTMHIAADAVQAAIAIPLLHIGDVTAAAIRAAGFDKVGLLGTAFTMEKPFYRERIAAGIGGEVIVPSDADRATVHRIIYDELIAGIVRDESREEYRGVIARLVAQGAQAIILGCTEIMLLVGEDDSTVPLFDTTTLHAAAAVEAALS